MLQLLQTKKARIALLIGAVFWLFIVSDKVSLAMDLHTLADSAHNSTSHTSMQRGQGGTTGNGSTGADLRYFAVGTAASVMQAEASALPKQLVKALLEKEIDNGWGVVQSAL